MNVRAERRWEGDSSGFDAVFHAVALALDDDGFGVVEDAVEEGGGEGGVVVEDGGPVFEGLVGGQNDGAAFVALADDLKEQVGPAFVDGEIAQLVDGQEVGTGVLLKFLDEASGVVGSGEGIDDVDGGGEADAEARGGGGVAQGDGQVAFAQTDAANDDGVGLVLDELEAEEVLNLEAVDLGGPGEVELLEGLEDGEAGLLDTALA